MASQEYLLGDVVDGILGPHVAGDVGPDPRLIEAHEMAKRFRGPGPRLFDQLGFPIHSPMSSVPSEIVTQKNAPQGTSPARLDHTKLTYRLPPRIPADRRGGRPARAPPLTRRSWRLYS